MQYVTRLLLPGLYDYGTRRVRLLKAVTPFVGKIGFHKMSKGRPLDSLCLLLYKSFFTTCHCDPIHDAGLCRDRTFHVRTCRGQNGHG